MPCPPWVAGATVGARGANDPHQGGQPDWGHNTTPLRPAGNSPATAAESTRTRSGGGVPFPVFLPGVTSKHRGHRGQTRKTRVTRCRHWGFLSPVGTGDKAQSTGDTGDNLMRGSAQRCGACVDSRPGGAAGAFGPGCRGLRRWGVCAPSLGCRRPVHIPPKVGEYPGGSVHYDAPQLPTHRTGFQLPAWEKARKDPHRGASPWDSSAKGSPATAAHRRPRSPGRAMPSRGSNAAQVFTAGVNR